MTKENFEKTIFYMYPKQSSGRVTIPKSISKSLGWNHKDRLALNIERINGKIGIFLTNELNEAEKE